MRSWSCPAGFFLLSSVVKLSCAGYCSTHLPFLRFLRLCPLLIVVLLVVAWKSAFSGLLFPTSSYASASFLSRTAYFAYICVWFLHYQVSVTLLFCSIGFPLRLLNMDACVCAWLSLSCPCFSWVRVVCGFVDLLLLCSSSLLIFCFFSGPWIHVCVPQIVIRGNLRLTLRFIFFIFCLPLCLACLLACLPACLLAFILFFTMSFFLVLFLLLRLLLRLRLRLLLLFASASASSLRLLNIDKCVFGCY